MEAPACAHCAFPEVRLTPEGTLEGVLSENWQTGTVELTWSVSFWGWPDEHSGVDFRIESIPFAVPSWREFGGARAECTESGEPIDAYLYDGEHSYFEYVHIQALNQVGTKVRFAIDLGECEVDRVKVDPVEHTWADIDRLRVVVDAEFTGIAVRTSNGRLTDFIDTTGLVLEASGDTYRPTGGD